LRTCGGGGVSAQGGAGNASVPQAARTAAPCTVNGYWDSSITVRSLNSLYAFQACSQSGVVWAQANGMAKQSGSSRKVRK
jgi:hypothetical protein